MNATISPVDLEWTRQQSARASLFMGPPPGRTVTREQKVRVFNEMLTTRLKNCPTTVNTKTGPYAARAEMEANLRLFSGPDSLQGDDFTLAAAMLQSGMTPSAIRDAFAGKLPGLQLAVDPSTETKISDDQLEQHKKRVGRVNGLLKSLDRRNRKLAQKQAEHDERVARLKAETQKPEYLLWQFPSAMHECAHAVLAWGCGSEVRSIDAYDRKDGGGGLTTIEHDEETTVWQRVGIITAGPAIDGPSASVAMNCRSSLKGGTDADKLTDLLENYLWLDCYGPRPEIADLLRSEAMADIGREVAAWLSCHREIVEDLAVRLARMGGKINDDTSPCIAEIADEYEAKLAPFPKHPQSWAVAKRRLDYLEARVRIAKGGESPTAIKRATAELEAERRHLAPACQRHYAARLKEIGVN
jgi:hypothetical protein